MTERRKTAKAANLQTKKGRQTKAQKAHALAGIDRATFDALWSRIPEGVKRKCSAAELAQLAGMLHNPVKTPLATIENGCKTAMTHREGVEAGRENGGKMAEAGPINGVEMASAVSENGCEMAVTPRASTWNRAKIALQSFQDRLRRELSRVPALPQRGDIRQGLQTALTSLAVRLPWGRK